MKTCNKLMMLLALVAFFSTGCEEDDRDIFGVSSQSPSIAPDEACFYDLPGYKGASFCLNAAGEGSIVLPVLYRQVSAIAVGSAVTVEVCIGDNPADGPCRLETKSRASLDAGWDNRIASVDVRSKNPKPHPAATEYQQHCSAAGGETAAIKRPECSPSWKGYSPADATDALREAFHRAMLVGGSGIVRLRGPAYRYLYSRNFTSENLFHLWLPRFGCYGDDSPRECQPPFPAVRFEGELSTLKTEAETGLSILSGNHFEKLRLRGRYENGLNRPCGADTAISCRCYEGLVPEPRPPECDGSRFHYALNGSLSNDWTLQDSDINGFGGHAIFGASVDNVRILNNTVAWNVGAGVALYPSHTGHPGQNAEIVGNNIRFNGHDGMDILAINSTITDNNSSDNGWGDYPGDGSGILLCAGGNGANIARNRVERNREHGIYLNGCEKGVENVTVTDNLVIENVRAGFGFGGPLRNIKLMGNQILRNKDCYNSAGFPGVSFINNRCSSR